jgi:hypothetical protein
VGIYFYQKEENEEYTTLRYIGIYIQTCTANRSQFWVYIHRKVRAPLKHEGDTTVENSII